VAEGWRRWPAAAAVHLVSDVASALDDAAAFGVVPYKLSPESIFVDPRIGVLLGDLGALREVFGNVLVDDDGDVFTPPEVVKGGSAGARSSVYLCGALLYALLAGEPPGPDPVSSRRADLTLDFDVVMGRAMARDTLKRYRTASDFVDSACRALRIERPADAQAEAEESPVKAEKPPVASEEPPAASEEPPAASEEPPVASEEPPVDAEEPRPHTFVLGPAMFDIEPQDYEWRPPTPPWLRPLIVGLALAGVAVGALTGFRTGRPAAPPPEAGPQVAVAGMHLTLPAGWVTGEARGDEVLAAYPRRDLFAGLTIRKGAKVSSGGAGEDPVRLGTLDMWRHAGGSGTVVRYTLPTTRGGLSISCEGPPATLVKCERSISTLRLDGSRALPLEGVAPKPGFRAAVARYSRERASGRAALARARTPNAQRSAALALLQVSRRAARRLSGLAGAAPLARVVSDTAPAYTALAEAAAGGKRAGWHAAVADVRRAESAVAAELRRQR
jgi:hypothetical protein